MRQGFLRIIEILKKIVLAVFIVVICLVIVSMAEGKHPKFFGYQVLRVLTSSMQPTISENTCIIIKEVEEEELQVGDIITFVSEDSEIYGYYNTHRIYDIVEENGVRKYVTKGDANSDTDTQHVAYSQITGRYVRELPGGPLIGSLFVALSDNKVYFLVVMLPLALVLLSYLWQIIGHITHRYEEDEEEWEEEEEGLQEEENRELELELEKTAAEIFKKQSHNINNNK